MVPPPENIQDRSETRDEGRSLLIRGITFQDDGKVVECRTYRDGHSAIGAIGFTVIRASYGSNKTEGKGDYPRLPKLIISPIKILPFVFGTLWLITLITFGICLFRRYHVSYESSTIPRTSDDEQTPPTPEYATVILSTNGGNDLDTQGSSSGGLGLTGENPEEEKKKSSRKDSETHYMELSGNHGPTEYETLKSVTYESPRAENDVVPKGSSQGDSMSAGGTAMAKGQVKLEGSKAYYMDMSGNYGPTEYEAMKSLTYANV